MSTAPVLETKGLAVSLDGRWVVNDLDLTIPAGEFAAIVGPNGAGKTTLLRALAGLVSSWGELEVGGVPITDLDAKTRARALAYLPQGHSFHWPMPVMDVVALGRIPHGAGSGSLSESDRDIVIDAMAVTEIEALAHRSVTTLSGGERARVALARVIAVGAPVILADEPTAGLDTRYQLVMLDLLKRQVERGAAVVAVLHDLSLAARYADRILVMEAGKIVADGAPTKVLEQGLLSRVFGVDATVVERDGTRAIIPWGIRRGRRPNGSD